MTEPLLTISAFARAVDLAPSALRYYDEAGLLTPAEVDGRTGYRYYTPELERRAHMIRRMREVGVPVETMRRVLDGPSEQAADILRGFAQRADDAARRTSAAVDDLLVSIAEGETPAATLVATLDGPELASAIRRVSAAAGDESDPVLGVVLLDFAGSDLTVVATDRYWLATWTIRLDQPCTMKRRFVVPRTSTAELVAWLARRATITVSGDDELRFAAGDETLAVVTGVDRFPAYQLLFDAVTATCGRVTADRLALLDALGDDTVHVLRVAHDRLTVQPNGAAEGVRLQAATSGESIEIGFAPALLRSALTATVGSEVSLAYEAPNRPVRMTSADQRSFTALLMPTKLDR